MEITRRQAITGAAALAGAGALTGPSGAAAARRRTGGDDGRIAPPLSLTGGRLLDPATGRVTEDATIVFRGGRVIRAGAGARPTGHAIDVDGAFVLPGLLDGHVHVASIAEAQRALSLGATTVRSASANFFQDVGLRAIQELGVMRLPRMLAAGVFVRFPLGDNALADPRLAPLSDVPGEGVPPRALRRLTQVDLDRGVDQIKTASTQRAGLAEQDPREQTLDERQLRAIVETAAQHGASVMCHAHGDEGIRAAAAAGVRSIEHGTFAAEPTIELMAARGTFFLPTASALVDLAEPGGEYTDPRLVERGRQMLARMRQTVAMARAKGVAIAAGTDTGYSADSLSSIAGEIRLLADMGLPALDAIRAATTTAAALCRRRDVLGRLLPGYAADAVVVGGDPLADLKALDDIKLVVAAGWVARNEL